MAINPKFYDLANKCYQKSLDQDEDFARDMERKRKEDLSEELERDAVDASDTIDNSPSGPAPSRRGRF